MSLNHRSDNFNEFVILLMGQQKYDVTLVTIVRPAPSTFGSRPRPVMTPPELVSYDP